MSAPKPDLEGLLKQTLTPEGVGNLVNDLTKPKGKDPKESPIKLPTGPDKKDPKVAPKDPKEPKETPAKRPTATDRKNPKPDAKEPK